MENRIDLCVCIITCLHSNLILYGVKTNLCNNTAAVSMTTLFNLGEITLSRFSPVTALFIWAISSSEQKISLVTCEVFCMKLHTIGSWSLFEPAGASVVWKKKGQAWSPGKERCCHLIFFVVALLKDNALSSVHNNPSAHQKTTNVFSCNSGWAFLTKRSGAKRT